MCPSFVSLLACCALLCFALLHFNSTAHSRRTNADGAPTYTVFKQPLALHSTKPMTGYMRNGYCEAPKSDQGNHSVAGAFTIFYCFFVSPPPAHHVELGLLTY